MFANGIGSYEKSDINTFDVRMKIIKNLKNKAFYAFQIRMKYV